MDTKFPLHYAYFSAGLPHSLVQHLLERNARVCTSLDRNKDIQNFQEMSFNVSKFTVWLGVRIVLSRSLNEHTHTHTQMHIHKQISNPDMDNSMQAWNIITK